MLLKIRAEKGGRAVVILGAVMLKRPGKYESSMMARESMTVKPVFSSYLSMLWGSGVSMRRK